MSFEQKIGITVSYRGLSFSSVADAIDVLQSTGRGDKALRVPGAPTSAVVAYPESIEKSIKAVVDVDADKTGHGQAEKQPQVAATALNRISRRTGQRRHIDLDRPGFLRLADVLEIIPVSRAAWYAGIPARYPAPVRLGGGRSVGWTTASIKKLVEDLTAGSKGQEGGAST